MRDEHGTNPPGTSWAPTPDGDRECYQFDFDVQALVTMRRAHALVESSRAEPPPRIGGMPPMPAFVVEPDRD